MLASLWYGFWDTSLWPHAVAFDEIAPVELKNVADGAFWDPNDKAGSVSLSNGNLTATLVAPVLVTADFVMGLTPIATTKSDAAAPMETRAAGAQVVTLEDTVTPVTLEDTTTPVTTES